MRYLVLGSLAVGLFALDRALLAAEARGWVYYRRRRPQALGAAVGPIFEVFQPTRTVVVAQREEQSRRRVSFGDTAPPQEGLIDTAPPQEG